MRAELGFGLCKLPFAGRAPVGGGCESIGASGPPGCYWLAIPSPGLGVGGLRPHKTECRKFGCKADCEKWILFFYQFPLRNLRFIFIRKDPSQVFG